MLLETMVAKTLMTMRRWNTLKLFDTLNQQSQTGFEHVAQPSKISYKKCQIKAKQRRPLTI